MLTRAEARDGKFSSAELLVAASHKSPTELPRHSYKIKFSIDGFVSRLQMKSGNRPNFILLVKNRGKECGRGRERT